MPIYEYECPKCGKRQEVIHSFSSQPDVLCCSSACERVMSQCAIHGTASTKTFEYRAVEAFRNGAEERRVAAEGSHMGSDPYETMQTSAPEIVDSL